MMKYRMVILTAGLFTLMAFAGASAWAEGFKHIPLQYIVALGDPNATAGTGAQAWGLWRQDPGPRGCRLENYDTLKATGVAPEKWAFDGKDWWLEEHGLIMEKPEFPLAPGKYVVTGGREVTSVLTVYPKEQDGAQRWELANGAKLYDVTHLPCHAARYTPTGHQACSPDKVQKTAFPVDPGVAMPVVDGCRKQDYAVLFVVGVAE
jgi:hypothetical protein